MLSAVLSRTAACGAQWRVTFALVHNYSNRFSDYSGCYMPLLYGAAQEKTSSRLNNKTRVTLSRRLHPTLRARSEGKNGRQRWIYKKLMVRRTMSPVLFSKAAFWAHHQFAEGTCRRAQNAPHVRASWQSRCPRPSTRPSGAVAAQLVNLVVRWNRDTE